MILAVNNLWTFKKIWGSHTNWRRDFCYANVFTRRPLTEKERQKEKRLLKGRYQLINEGTKTLDKRALYAKNLCLFVKGDEFVVDALVEKMIVMLVHVRSLKKSLALEELTFYLSLSDSYLPFITKTWLSEKTDSSSISISSYKTYRQDRKSVNSKRTAGWGIFVCVDSTITSEQLPFEDSDLFELSWLKFIIKGTIVVFGLLYYPFSQRKVHEQKELQSHIKITTTVRAKKYSKSYVLMVDFNGFDSQGLWG